MKTRSLMMLIAMSLSTAAFAIENQTIPRMQVGISVPGDVLYSFTVKGYSTSSPPMAVGARHSSSVTVGADQFPLKASIVKDKMHLSVDGTIVNEGKDMGFTLSEDTLDYKLYLKCNADWLNLNAAMPVTCPIKLDGVASAIIQVCRINDSTCDGQIKPAQQGI